MDTGSSAATLSDKQWYSLLKSDEKPDWLWEQETHTKPDVHTVSLPVASASVNGFRIRKLSFPILPHCIDRRRSQLTVWRLHGQFEAS